MAKPITDEQVAAFRQQCRELVDDAEASIGNANDPDGGPVVSGYLTVESVDMFNGEDEDGNPLWEFHAANYDPSTSHDIYELFEKVDDEFEIEEEGYGSFFVSRRSGP